MNEKNAQLLIMRHAKSDIGINQADFDRTLNKDAYEQLNVIAQKINELGINIDLAMVSPSLRTLDSFKGLIKKLKQSPAIIIEDRIYNANLASLIDIIEQQRASAKTMLLLGHNPSVSELTHYACERFIQFGPANVAILSTINPISQAIKTKGNFNLDNFLVPGC